MPKRQSALHTLIRQSHQAPACEGRTPERGENSGPGKDCIRELDARPGIREQPGSRVDCACQEPSGTACSIGRQLDKQYETSRRTTLVVPTKFELRGDQPLLARMENS